MNSRILRAILLFENSRIIEAEAELRAAIAEGDNSADSHAMLGLCLLHAGLKDDALKEVKSALGREPENPFPHYALSLVQEASLQ